MVLRRVLAGGLPAWWASNHGSPSAARQPAIIAYRVHHGYCEFTAKRASRPPHGLFVTCSMLVTSSSHRTPTSPSRRHHHTPTTSIAHEYCHAHNARPTATAAYTIVYRSTTAPGGWLVKQPPPPPPAHRTTGNTIHHHVTPGWGGVAPTVTHRHWRTSNGGGACVRRGGVSSHV